MSTVNFVSGTLAALGGGSVFTPVAASNTFEVQVNTVLGAFSGTFEVQESLDGVNFQAITNQGVPYSFSAGVMEQFTVAAPGAQYRIAVTGWNSGSVLYNFRQ